MPLLDRIVQNLKDTDIFTKAVKARSQWKSPKKLPVKNA
jgi:hypothetical protein